MRVTVCDVGPRDRLQNERVTLEPAVRAEGLVCLLYGEGVYTGVDLDALIGASTRLEGVLGRELPGQVYGAGAFAPVCG